MKLEEPAENGGTKDQTAKATEPNNAPVEVEWAADGIKINYANNAEGKSASSENLVVRNAKNVTGKE